MNKFKLYSRVSDHETFLEIWESGAERPGAVFIYSPAFCANNYGELIPWIFECAGKFRSPYVAFELAQWGLCFI